MITGYYRPKTLDEALKLLETPNNIPIGGGTTFMHIKRDVSVVDLQNLSLNIIREGDATIQIGSTTTLETMLKYFDPYKSIKEAIKIEASRNQREQVTLAGLVCASGGRSALLTLLLAINPVMVWQPGNIEIPLGEYLAQRNYWKKGVLITDFIFDKKIIFGFESIGRSPYDVPILCIAAAKWSSNRLRVTAGGFGDLPTIVMDGNINDNLELAIENALLAASDEWASAEYRIAAGKKIVSRIKNEFE